jgi:transcriptional regulator with XRE-family HTH domain
MADRRTASSSLSARVVEYLRRRGHSQAKIARMLGVSEGFVSLVKTKERSLTLDHIELMADKLRVPLGAFLLAVTEPPRRKRGTARLFELSAQIMQRADAVQEAILRQPTGGSRG